MLEEIKSAVSFIRILWFYNVGDEAILQSIIKALHEEDPTLELVVLSNDPDYTKNVRCRGSKSLGYKSNL